MIPAQTVGPFFHYALPYPRDRELVPPGSPSAVLLHGVIRDGAGHGLPDALIEIRQADGAGAVPTATGSLRRDGITFTGWGRTHTDSSGHYWFSTVVPGPTHHGALPFISVTVFATGLLDRLFTRIYLPADPVALAADSFLATLTPDERAGLVAVPDGEASLRFDIDLQGDRETVFLSFPRHRE